MNAQLKEVPEIDTPRIYVACLASYNNGILHGAWIDAVNGVDAMRDGINAMLKASPMPNAEEWAIHDSVWIDLNECDNLERVHDIAMFIEEHGELGYELMKMNGGNVPYSIEMLEDHYHGEWDSKRDFVYDLVESCGYLDGASETIKRYFDYEAFERDLFISDYDDIYISGSGYHIFSTH
jgi:antirestriction protein